MFACNLVVRRGNTVQILDMSPEVHCNLCNHCYTLACPAQSQTLGVYSTCVKVHKRCPLSDQDFSVLLDQELTNSSPRLLSLTRSRLLNLDQDHELIKSLNLEQIMSSSRLLNLDQDHDFPDLSDQDFLILSDQDLARPSDQLHF